MRSWRRSPAASARLALSRAAHDAGGAGGAGAWCQPSVHMSPESTRPVHVEAQFRGSAQARGRRVRGRVHVAAQFAGVPASSGQTCTDSVHMGLLLTGSRELGPDECHRKLNHVRNCQTCTGPFVKTLIAQLIYLMLCGIRLIPHGTRLARVRIFRYTWAGSCHGWNSYGTRRPRACGIPRVSAPRVPAGRASRTHEGRVCRPPANWGQACTAKAPPGTRPARVSCGRANSRQTCTGTQHRPYSRGPSSRRACKLAADVYRRAPRPGSPPRRPRYRCRSKCPLRARFLRLMTVPCMPWGM